MGFDDLNTNTSDKNSFRIDEEFPLFNFKDAGKTWQRFRLLPIDPIPVGMYWFDVVTKDDKKIRIPKYAPSFNMDKDEVNSSIKDPYAERGAMLTKSYILLGIHRQSQENEPTKKKLTKEEKKTGIKDKNSNSWTPVVVLRLTKSTMAAIIGLKGLNTRTNKRTGKVTYHHVNEEKYGADIAILYDEKAKGNQKYQIQKMGRSPLTEEEKNYLTWDIAKIKEKIIPEPYAEALINAKRLLNDNSTNESSKDDEDDEDDKDSVLNLYGKNKKKKKYDVDDEDEDDDLEDDDDDEDDDLEDDDDDDDEDEDDEPPVKKKKKRKPTTAKKKKRIIDEDDEDEDEDEDDDLEDDDDDDEDLDEDDEDDEDEDDEPPVKKKKKRKPTTTKKKKRIIDEDDDDEDEDDEDDEDDEIPVKKKKKSTTTKKKKSSNKTK